MVATVDNCLVLGMFKIMNALLARYHRREDQDPLTPEEIESANVAALPMWVFSFVWSVGATVGASGRKKLEAFVRQRAEDGGFAEHMPPAEMQIYDYCYDQDELVRARRRLGRRGRGGMLCGL